jgi:hypothetical protein
MTFMNRWPKGKEKAFFRPDCKDGQPQSNFEWATHLVKFTDARPERDAYHIDTHGFTWLDDPIEPGLLQKIRDDDQTAIETVYSPRIHDLVQKITGAERVICFSPLVRTSDPSKGVFQKPAQTVSLSCPL